ncbi:hypothetical protein [Lentzea terrae]|uniref:hypothetical protein n=1 Tax=Lentzea terrae TaxID=2200761 RepID=UPI00130045DD
MRRHGSRTIAATAHFATEVLDGGHIIAQVSRQIDALGPTPSTADLASADRTGFVPPAQPPRSPPNG